MRTILLLLALLSCRIAGAESSNVYMVGGIGAGGGKQHSQAALGGEIVLHRFFGWGGEIGGVAGHDSFIVSSVNGYCHLPISSREKVGLFATAGYTRGVSFPLGPGRNLANFGAGLHYWFRRRIGVRVEFRDLLPHPGSNVDRAGHLYGIRAGIAFR